MQSEHVDPPSLQDEGFNHGIAAIAVALAFVDTGALPLAEIAVLFLACRLLPELCHRWSALRGTSIVALLTWAWMAVRAMYGLSPRALVDSLQLFGVLVAGVMLFRFVALRSRHAVSLTLAVGCAVSVAAALVQTLGGVAAARIGGLLGCRAPYGVIVAGSIPFLLQWCHDRPGSGRRKALLLASFAAAGVVSCHHLPTFVLTTIAVVAWGGFRLERRAATAGALIGVAVSLLTPGHRASLAQSVASADAQGKTRRWVVEIVAARTAVAERPWAGHGPGSFQTVVSSGRFRESLPATAENVVEPRTQFGYLVAAVEFGLPAAVLLFLCFSHAAWTVFRSACRARGISAGDGAIPGGSCVSDEDRALGIAVLVTGIGMFFTPLLVRGTGVFAAVLLGQALAREEWADSGTRQPLPRAGLLRYAWTQAAVAAIVMALGTVIGLTTSSSDAERTELAPVPVDATEAIWLEAEAVTPLPRHCRVVSAPGASNRKALAVTDVPNEELVDAEGGDLPFEVEVDTTFRLWVRALWVHGCGNSVLAAVDDAPPVLVGNDATYGVWHWVQGPDIRLTAGPHTLRLTPREALVRIDQILLVDASDGGEPRVASGQPLEEIMAALPVQELPEPERTDGRFVAGVAGAFQPGLEAYFVQMGIPYVRLQERELWDANALAQYGMVWISGIGTSKAVPVFKACHDYVRAGGIAVLEKMNLWAAGNAPWTDVARALAPTGRLNDGPVSLPEQGADAKIRVRPAGSHLLAGIEEDAEVPHFVCVSRLGVPAQGSDTEGHGELWQHGRRVGAAITKRPLGKGMVYGLGLPLGFISMWRTEQFDSAARAIILEAIANRRIPLFAADRPNALQPSGHRRFADDFMRNPDEAGPWTVAHGDFRVTDPPLAAPPQFSKERRMKVNELAFTAVLTGPTWVTAAQTVGDGYRVSAAVRATEGRGGVWASSTRGRRVLLQLDTTGRLQLLAGSSQGVQTPVSVADTPPPHNGWRRISLMNRDGEWQGWIDGRCLLKAPAALENSTGRFGLFAATGTVRVDDVNVRSVKDLIPGTDRCPGEEGSCWADPGQHTGVEGRGIYASQWYLRPDPARRRSLRVAMPLYSDGALAVDGRLISRLDPDPDGPLITLPAAAVPVHTVSLVTRSWHDYMFRGALVDWYPTGGPYARRSRWSCDQKWEWLGTPRSDTPAVLWYRRPLAPPYAISVLCAPSMRGDERELEFTEADRDLNLVLGGNGESLDDAWLIRTGAEGKYGCRLLKGGEDIAVALETGLPEGGGFALHHRWVWVQAVVEPDRVRVFFDGRPALDCEVAIGDEPGRVGFWTRRNAAQIARATIADAGE